MQYVYQVYQPQHTTMLWTCCPLLQDPEGIWQKLHRAQLTPFHSLPSFFTLFIFPILLNFVDVHTTSQYSSRYLSSSLRRRSLGVEPLKVELGTSSLEGRAVRVGEMGSVDASSVSSVAYSVSLSICQYDGHR